MRFASDLASRLGVITELLVFFSKNKWRWLTPMIVILLLFSGLILLAQSSAVAPFIYTLF
jgi:hypothetical protein